MKGSVRANIALLLCAFIWGTAFVGQKTGMNSLGPFFFVAWRMIIGGIALIPIYLITERNNERRRVKNGQPETSEAEKKAKLRITLLGGLACGVFIYFANTFQQIGLQYTTAGKSAFITTLYIILVPIIGIFLKHKTTLKVWLGAVLAVIGLYFLCITDSFALTHGDAMVLLCSFFYAFHILTMDYFAPRVNVSLIVCIQSLVAAAIAFIVAPFLETFSWSGLWEALPSLLYVGVLSTGIAYALQGLGQKDANPTVASILMSLESVFAVISGFLLLNEGFTVREFIGCCIMFAAIIVAQLPDRKSTTPAERV